MTRSAAANRALARQRLLRCLKAGPCAFRQAGREGLVLVERSDGGAVPVPAAQLASMLAAGEIALCGRDRLALPEAHGARAAMSRPAINSSESPLAMLARRRDKAGKPFLDGTELLAGEKLRADFERARIMPHVSVNWELAGTTRGVFNGSADHSSAAAMSARRAVNAALDSVGPEFAGLLVDVCCFLKGLEQVEMERQWPARSAKIMLKAGLSALARHYNPQRGNTAAMRHWGEAGFKPEL